MKSAFQKETDLCAAFIAAIPEGWTAYPETGGFDILLVRKEDGFQIGVEAKLKLNSKVISQAAEQASSWYACYSGPDCRAVLVPDSCSHEMSSVCRFIGVTVIRMPEPGVDTRKYWYGKFDPHLPEIGDGPDYWHEIAPTKRLHVPDWIPDVKAGASSPVTLTYWKIMAIKIVITIEKRGYVTRRDFKHIGISLRRWISGTGWLKSDGNGNWIKGPNLPDFKAQHPINYDQIAAEYDKWKTPEMVMA